MRAMGVVSRTGLRVLVHKEAETLFRSLADQFPLSYRSDWEDVCKLMDRVKKGNHTSE